MNFKSILSQRISMDDVCEILHLAEQSNEQKQELYDLVIGADQKIGYHAAWIFTHFSPEANKWMYEKQNELVDEVMVCKHSGKRRLILSLLYKQPLANPPRVDFLDFSLEGMLSAEELPGVRSLCMKIAYELCRPIPELAQEFATSLEMMDSDLCPALYACRKNILKAMHTGKSLQKY